MSLLLFYLVYDLIFPLSFSRVRRLIKNYLPSKMGGGPSDTKLYSVLGDGDEVNSLFADDDMFLDDNGLFYFFF